MDIDKSENEENEETEKCESILGEILIKSILMANDKR